MKVSWTIRACHKRINSTLPFVGGSVLYMEDMVDFCESTLGHYVMSARENGSIKRASAAAVLMMTRSAADNAGLQCKARHGMQGMQGELKGTFWQRLHVARLFSASVSVDGQHIWLTSQVLVPCLRDCESQH